jgi:uncharacterized Zn ribbon protein
MGDAEPKISAPVPFRRQCEKCDSLFISLDIDARVCGQCKARWQKHPAIIEEQEQRVGGI